MSNKNLTFSGTDTLAFIVLPNTTPIVLGSLTTLSYSSYRIKKPVNTIGGIVIKGIAKGGRIIAGTLIFTLINQHWVNELLEFVPWLKEKSDDIIYSDELPLFDIMVVSANEYGKYVSMMIYGVDLTDEAQVLSVNDMYTENTFSFIAREIKPFSNKDSNFKNGIYHSNNAFISNNTKLNFDWNYDYSNNTNNSTTSSDNNFSKIKDILIDLGYNVSSNKYDNEVQKNIYDIIDKMELGTDIDISWFINNVLLKINPEFIDNNNFYANDNINTQLYPGTYEKYNILSTIYKDNRVIVLDKKQINSELFYLTTSGWVNMNDLHVPETIISNIEDILLDGKSIKDEILNNGSDYSITTDLKVSEFLDRFEIKFSNAIAQPTNMLEKSNSVSYKIPFDFWTEDENPLNLLHENESGELSKFVTEYDETNTEYISNINFKDDMNFVVNTVKRFNYINGEHSLRFSDRKDIILEKYNIENPFYIIIASNDIDDSLFITVRFSRKVVN